MRIRHEEAKMTIRVLDGMAYFNTGLDKAGAALGLGRKAEMDDASKKRFTRDDMDDLAFRRYALTDAWLTRKIGEYIIGMHEDYDVTTCLTAPHFAAQVFKRHFLTAPIPLATPEVEQAGLSAYHGGKNGFYLPGPARLSSVWAYDITSAYPEAMRRLPDPTRAAWVASAYRPGADALWCVDMDYIGCPYPGALTHDDVKLAPGHYEGLWVTSYELDAILERNEATVRSCHGYVMSGPRGGPLVKYVDKFFAQKATTTGPIREQAKLFLNALYGKFFQKVELGSVGHYDFATGEEIVSNDDADFDYRAGGLYHPPIAGLITGYVRAKIHRLEHKYQSVMTSTDGFFGLVAPDPNDVGRHLGGLTAEAGALSIWRERLYAFDPHDSDGKTKYALHGFRGNLDALRQVPLESGTWTYNAETAIMLRQARTLHGGRSVRAGQFVMEQFSVTV
jgi:hypothetical protein